MSGQESRIGGGGPQRSRKEARGRRRCSRTHCHHICPRTSKVDAVVPVLQIRTLRHSGCAHLTGSQGRGLRRPGEWAEGWSPQRGPRVGARFPGTRGQVVSPRSSPARSATLLNSVSHGRPPASRRPLLPGTQVQCPACFAEGVGFSVRGAPRAGDGEGRRPEAALREEEGGLTIQRLRPRAHSPVRPQRPHPPAPVPVSEPPVPARCAHAVLMTLCEVQEIRVPLSSNPM